MEPTNIDLEYIYADQYENRQETTVYSNGEMQVSVFISVNYNGEETDTTVQEITDYVQANAIVYSLTESKNVDWPKSTTENEFEHDVNNAATKSLAGKGRFAVGKGKPAATAKGKLSARIPRPANVKASQSVGPKLLPDVRVPLYFTVPQSKSGKYNWIAKLDGKETSTGSPLVVTVNSFAIDPSGFDVYDVPTHYNPSCQTLRALRYKAGALPSGHKLVKPLNYKGYKFNSSGAKCWVSMLHGTSGHKAGCFVEYRQTNVGYVAKNDYAYQSDEYDVNGIDRYEQMLTSDHGWEDSDVFSEGDLEAAWDEGIAMLIVVEKHLWIEKNKYPHAKTFNYEMQGFRIQDNFGNNMSVNFNWDYGGNWFWNWSVSSVTVENN